jgi:SAM-dependent methyltransferase
MLLPDTAQALGEARRVLRQGGRLAYAVPGSPDRNPWMSLFMGALLQSGHGPPAGDPFAAGGPFSLSPPGRSRELLGGTGFSDVRVEEIGGLMHFDSLDDYWNLQRAVAGPAALLIASLPAGEVDSIRAALESMVAPFKSGSAYEFPWLALAVGAT